MAKFYLTTTLPYVNADPHLGFALEIVQADIIARFHKLLGEDIVFNTGTDEHGQKIYQKALEARETPKAYAEKHAENFEKLKKALNLSYTHFIRTTDPSHIEAAEAFWKRCDENGDIYKQIYKIKYCVGCELEKTDSELTDGICPIHPNLKLEVIKEENYFFRFSKYQTPLLEYYEKNPKFVVPDFRFNEIKNFVKAGLADFSISRLKEKMPWGIPVPDDENQVMYVWFYALIKYISTIGWRKNDKNFEEFWGTINNPNAIQIAGKDNLRQQSAMWQAMLMSAGLPNSKPILIPGFITSNGQKMSKSLGNVINPFEIVEKYGTDALRYWLATLSPFDDGDFTWDKFKEVYNADLANGLGNLVSRVAKLCETSGFSYHVIPARRFEEASPLGGQAGIQEQVKKELEKYRFDEAIKKIWENVTKANQSINETKPWTLQGEELKKSLRNLVLMIDLIASDLKPFLPETAEKIEEQFKGPKIVSKEPLFPRI